MRVSVTAHPSQYLVLPVSENVALLIGIWWYLLMVSLALLQSFNNSLLTNDRVVVPCFSVSYMSSLVD